MKKFKIGDRVSLVNKSTEGWIAQIVFENEWTLFADEETKYLVKYDGDWMPPQDWHFEYELIAVDGSEEEQTMICDCGAESANASAHSDWCSIGKPIKLPTGALPIETAGAGSPRDIIHSDNTDDWVQLGFPNLGAGDIWTDDSSS